MLLFDRDAALWKWNLEAMRRQSLMDIAKQFMRDATAVRRPPYPAKHFEIERRLTILTQAYPGFGKLHDFVVAVGNIGQHCAGNS